MKIFVMAVVSALVLAGAWVMAQDPAPTNLQGLMTASGAYDQSQKEMAEAYSKLMGAVTPVGKERLKKSQVAWTQYRDAQSEFLCFHLAGGPYEKMDYYAQLRKETDRRTRDLKNTYEWYRKVALKEQ